MQQDNQFTGNRPSSMKLVLALCACALVLAPPLLINLGDAGIFLWDESREASNSLEMAFNGKWLMQYYDGVPETWNTKPQLLTWLQVASYKLFGISEFSTRIPVALAVLGLGTFFVYFSWKEFGRLLPGVFAALTLVTTPAITGAHIARSGDRDGLLITCLFLSLACLYWWLHRRKAILLTLATLFMLLAVLTKSIVGLLYLPGVALYLLLSRLVPDQIISCLKRPTLYFHAIALMFLIAAYYGLREYYYPGYLELVWQNELGGRYLDTLEGHLHPFGFYWNNSSYRWTPWHYVLPAFPLALWANRKSMPPGFGILIGCVAATFLLVISAAQTKIAWYDAPLLALLSWMAAWVFTALFDHICRVLKVSRARDRAIVAIAAGLVLFSWPYAQTIAKVMAPHPSLLVEQYGPYLKQIAAKYPERKSITLLFDFGSNQPLVFYKNWFNLQHGYDTVLAKSSDDIKAGHYVITCQLSRSKALRSRYRVQVLDRQDTCEFLSIAHSALTSGRHD